MARMITVSRQLARSLVRTAADACLPGSALPQDEARMATPRGLAGLVSEYGLVQAPSLPRAAGVALTDDRPVSSNCNNRILALDWGEEREDLPRSLFLKLPVHGFATRVFFGLIMSWELECAFYRGVGPRVPVRIPTVYAAASQRSRFLLLMENLAEDPTVTLFNNHDMLQGPDMATVERCLGSLAAIHAAFHAIGSEERDRLLPPRLQPFTSPLMRALSPMMGRAAMAACRRRGDLELTARHLAWFERGLNHWNRLVDHWTDEPLTLVHGDSHLGNHFLHGDQAGMIDWQAAQWGKGIRDVQYFLTDSLPADTLARNEERLVRHYLAALAGHGVELAFEESWRQYRGFSFQTWMTIVVSMGLGAMTEEMNEVMPEIHRRCIASIERLALGDWLEDVLGNE